MLYKAKIVFLFLESLTVCGNIACSIERIGATGVVL
jgi:hypothetical protein